MPLYTRLENNYIRELDIQAFVSAGVIQNQNFWKERLDIGVGEKNEIAYTVVNRRGQLAFREGHPSPAKVTLRRFDRAPRSNSPPFFSLAQGHPSPLALCVCKDLPP